MKITNESSQEIKDFYNEFSKKQLATGINLRHYYLFRKIIQSGIKRHHNILEIGCGIGTLTGLLANYLKSGQIVATDISDENIELAKKRLKTQKRINFLVTDMQDFSYDEKFDFVVMADVLEHIPIQLHGTLFQTITNHMEDEAILFINIPHPKNIEFYRKNYPEKLQIVDQALYAEELTNTAAQNGLTLSEYIPYALYHHERDYILIKFETSKKITYNPISKNRIIWKKLLNRLFYWSTRF